MTGAAEQFAQQAPGVASATVSQRGDLLHTYHGELSDRVGTVRIHALAPGVTDEDVHDAFARVASAWHNPSTHPNVVTVYERGREPRPWVAVGLIDGQTLEESRSDLTVPEMRAVVADTAEALRNAGLYNTVHLDLTPDCIWVTEGADGPEAVVDGWGLERACRVAAGETPVTSFTAPELRENPDGGTERADVFGLGAVTYYALTGRPPSGPMGGSDGAGGGPAPPSTVASREGVTERVDDVVMQALAADPADRYDSAYAFNTAITSALPADVSEPTSGAGTGRNDPQEDATARDSPESGREREPGARSAGESEPEAGISADNIDEHYDGSEAETDESNHSVARRAVLGVLGLAGLGAVGGAGWYLTSTESNPLQSLQAGGGSSAPASSSESPAPPSVRLSAATREAATGQQVTFVADATVGEDVSIETYEWAIGSDGDFSRGEARMTHSFASPGEYTVRVRVTDSRDRTATASIFVTVVGSVGGAPMFQYDILNTGHAPDESGPIGSVTERWAFRTDNEVYSSPAVVDGTVYVGSDDNHVYALSADDGTQQWRVGTGGRVFSSPAVVDGTVYVGSGDGRVYALSATDGTRQWHHETGGSVLSSPAVVDGTVYVGSSDNHVYALSADDGTRQWRVETGGRVVSSPAVSNGTVYVSSGNGRLHALDAERGSRQWTVGVSARFSSPTVIDGTVYVGSLDNRVHTLEAESGERRWTAETDTPIFGSPAVADGTIYVGTLGGLMYALDADSGGKRWTVKTDNRIFSSPAVVDGTVYVGSGDNHVYALNATDGTRRWRYETGDRVFSSPAVVDGTVYVGGVDGRVYALK